MDTFTQNCQVASDALEALLPYVQTTISPRILRTMKSKKMSDKYLSEPFTWGEVTLRFAVYMGYSRYVDDAGKIREEGIISIYPQKKGYRDWYQYHGLIEVNRVYHKAEQVPTLLLELKPIILQMLMTKFYPRACLV